MYTAEFERYLALGVPFDLSLTSLSAETLQKIEDRVEVDAAARLQAVLRSASWKKLARRVEAGCPHSDDTDYYRSAAVEGSGSAVLSERCDCSGTRYRTGGTIL